MLLRNVRTESELLRFEEIRDSLALESHVQREVQFKSKCHPTQSFDVCHHPSSRWFGIFSSFEVV